MTGRMQEEGIPSGGLVHPRTRVGGGAQRESTAEGEAEAVLERMGGAGVERESAERSPSGGYPFLRHNRTRDGITSPCCCHGSKIWDDDSKKRLKCCHGSKEWDDGSTQELR